MAASKKKPAQPKEGPLSPRMLEFCRQYTIDLIGTQAAIRAGYNTRTAAEQSSRLLTKSNIRAEIQRLMDERSKRTEISADNALRIIWERATADPRELVEVRVGCCRHCHGIDFGYQSTVAEMNKARDEWTRAGKALELFDERGGIGFDPKKQPHPDCPHCAGDGDPRVVLKDTSTLSPQAASLYAGAKMGKYGLEVQLHDQAKHIEMMGRHLKLFTDKIELEVGDELATRLKEARERVAKQVRG